MQVTPLPWTEGRQGLGGMWGRPLGITVSPSMLQQLLLGKLHPTTLDLRGDAHGEKTVPVLTGEEFTITPLGRKGSVPKSAIRTS